MEREGKRVDREGRRGKERGWIEKEGKGRREVGG
jgi:hypothetical protein